MKGAIDSKGALKIALILLCQNCAVAFTPEADVTVPIEASVSEPTPDARVDAPIDVTPAAPSTGDASGVDSGAAADVGTSAPDVRTAEASAPDSADASDAMTRCLLQPSDTPYYVCGGTEEILCPAGLDPRSPDQYGGLIRCSQPQVYPWDRSLWYWCCQ